MTREEAIQTLNAMFCQYSHIRKSDSEWDAIIMAIEALKLTAVKECSTCSDKGCCAIFDNFNIDYCSDYRGGVND